MHSIQSFELEDAKTRMKICKAIGIRIFSGTNTGKDLRYDTQDNEFYYKDSGESFIKLPENCIRLSIHGWNEEEKP